MSAADPRAQFAAVELAAILADAEYQLHMLRARPERAIRDRWSPPVAALRSIDRCESCGAWRWSGTCWTPAPDRGRS